MPLFKYGEHLGRTVATTVIDDNDFVVKAGSELVEGIQTALDNLLGVEADDNDGKDRLIFHITTS